jgi:hypothetical protein
MEINFLQVSSLIFITNAAAAYYKRYYLYSFLFLLLTTTSLIVHYNNTIYTNIIDKISILFIVLYGGYLLFRSFSVDPYRLVIVATFIGTILLYIYGYMIEDFCFHPDKSIGCNYHCILHLIGSIGHHLIIFV